MAENLFGKVLQSRHGCPFPDAGFTDQRKKVGAFRLPSFAIEWKGHYRIEGSAFVHADRDTGRVTTILGYPTQKIAQAR